jgi:type VI protein secretion system component Hcp
MPTRKILIEIPDFLINGSVFKTGIESFNWSENRTVGASDGANRETTSMPRRTIVVNRVRDKYSPVFHQTSAITKRFQKVKITVTQSDKGVVRQTNSYEFHNVVFADYETGVASGGMPPVEEFTLDFVTVDFNNGLPTDQPSPRRSDQFDLRSLRRQ